MTERRWFNSRLPQTLVISQFLLYFDAAFATLDLLGIMASDVPLTVAGRLLLLAGVGLAVYGAYGIANEMKRGYQVAVVASFAPIAVRFLIALLYANPLEHLGYFLLPGGLIGALFTYALIALLLHKQSREHQKIWFS